MDEVLSEHPGFADLFDTSESEVSGDTHSSMPGGRYYLTRIPVDILESVGRGPVDSLESVGRPTQVITTTG